MIGTQCKPYIHTTVRVKELRMKNNGCLYGWDFIQPLQSLPITSNWYTYRLSCSNGGSSGGGASSSSSLCCCLPCHAFAIWALVLGEMIVWHATSRTRTYWRHFFCTSLSICYDVHENKKDYLGRWWSQWCGLL